MGVIKTGQVKSVTCPMCENIRTIEVLDVIVDYSGFKCNHVEKDYMERKRHKMLSTHIIGQLRDMKPHLKTLNPLFQNSEQINSTN